MVVCDLLVFLPKSFLGIWATFCTAAALSFAALSGSTFYWLYSKATFKKWQHKSSGKFPSAHNVREEIYQTYKGVLFGTLLPALSMYLRNESYMHGYCPADITNNLEGAGGPNFLLDAISDQKLSIVRTLAELLLIVVVTDFFEFIYHWCGHYFDACWNVHRHHHKYFNPTPWAVIADEPLDNLVRASPLFFLPFFFPINLNTMFLTFFVFFYTYGTYLHCGYEADWIIASDHWLVNTSFQHYVHHAKGTRSRPYHCGFFVKVWDNIFQSTYDGPECFARTERAQGKRSWKIWEEEVLPAFPNYALLLDPKFLWYGETHPDFKGKLTLDLRDLVSTAASDDSDSKERSEVKDSKASLTSVTKED